MPHYRTSDRPIDSMAPQEIRDEAAELRVQIRHAENSLATKAAWARSEGTTETPKYLKWTASAKTYLAKLTDRYAVVREAERALNRKER